MDDLEIKDNNKNDDYKMFEDIKHIDENGNEFWYARELQILLTYKKWEKFQDVIEKLKIACKKSGYDIEDHFLQVGKTIKMPKNAEKIIIEYK